MLPTGTASATSAAAAATSAGNRATSAAAAAAAAGQVRQLAIAITNCMSSLEQLYTACCSKDFQSDRHLGSKAKTSGVNPKGFAECTSLSPVERPLGRCR